MAMIAFQVPMETWQRFALPLFLLGVVLLVLVLIPGIGRSVNGARRWIPLGIMNMQPSELMKLFAVLYAADYTVRKAAVMHSIKQGFLPMAGAMVFVGWLLLREPDMGAFVVIAAVTLDNRSIQTVLVPLGQFASNGDVEFLSQSCPWPVSVTARRKCRPRVSRRRD